MSFCPECRKPCRAELEEDGGGTSEHFGQVRYESAFTWFSSSCCGVEVVDELEELEEDPEE